MIRTIYEILTARKFRHNDPDVGLLKRVGGYWRIEMPKKTLGVSIKIYGSDRFGPNKESLNNYKKRKDEIESIWLQCIEAIIEETRNDKGEVRFKADEFIPAEIIFGPRNKFDIEFTYAFNIISAPNEYGANVKDGQYENYYSLYG